jgi:hypothetical protein
VCWPHSIRFNRYDLDGLPVYRSAVTFRLLVGDGEATVRCESCGVYAEDPDAIGASTATADADGGATTTDDTLSPTLEFLWAKQAAGDRAEECMDISLGDTTNGVVASDCFDSELEGVSAAMTSSCVHKWRCPVCFGRFAPQHPFRSTALAPPPVQWDTQMFKYK